MRIARDKSEILSAYCYIDKTKDGLLIVKDAVVDVQKFNGEVLMSKVYCK